jgi:hypothetical protein
MHGGYETLFCINTRQTNYPFNKMEIRALLYLKICLVGLSMTSVIKEPIFKDSRVTAVMWFVPSWSWNVEKLDLKNNFRVGPDITQRWIWHTSSQQQIRRQ